MRRAVTESSTSSVARALPPIVPQLIPEVRAADDITIDDILAGVDDAEVLEDYPTFAKGPCVLVLELDSLSRPIHVV